MCECPNVKIVVVGDSGVGKTALCHLLCYQTCLLNPSWTIGCQVEVKMHEYKAGTPLSTSYYVDFWDIGGSASHENARLLFYQDADGLILVHDVSNKKSEANLHKWHKEALLNRKGNSLESVSSGGFSNVTESSQPTLSLLNPLRSGGVNLRRPITSKENGSGYSMNSQLDAMHQQQVNSTSSPLRSTSRVTEFPVLVIGNKMDQVVKSAEYAVIKKTGGFAHVENFEEIFLSCHDPQWLSAGSSNAVQLDRFFDRVIDYKLCHETGGNSAHSSVFARGSSYGTSSNQYLVNGKVLD